MILRRPWVPKLLGGSIAERFGIRCVSTIEYCTLRAHKDHAVLQRIRKAQWERKTLVTFNEAYIVNSLAASVAGTDGDFAEMGVYEGSTAKLLCETKGGQDAASV